MAAQTEAAESREAKVMRRLAGALDDYGLSTIGKSVAMAYLRETAGRRHGARPGVVAPQAQWQ